MKSVVFFFCLKLPNSLRNTINKNLPTLHIVCQSKETKPKENNFWVQFLCRCLAIDQKFSQFTLLRSD